MDNSFNDIEHAVFNPLEHQLTILNRILIDIQVLIKEKGATTSLGGNV